MNDRVAIPLSKIRKARPTPKGRAVDAGAREEIAALLGEAPRAPEYLIENLHKVQDRFGSLRTGSGTGLDCKRPYCKP